MFDTHEFLSASVNFLGKNLHASAIPTGGTVEPISMAIAINGESVVSTTMISTSGEIGSYNNVFSAIFLDVPKGCCY